jgi:hypothetical protein
MSAGGRPPAPPAGTRRAAFEKWAEDTFPPLPRDRHGDQPSPYPRRICLRGGRPPAPPAGTRRAAFEKWAEDTFPRYPETATATNLRHTPAGYVCGGGDPPHPPPVLVGRRSRSGPRTHSPRYPETATATNLRHTPAGYVCGGGDPPHPPPVMSAGGRPPAPPAGTHSALDASRADDPKLPAGQRASRRRSVCQCSSQEGSHLSQGLHRADSRVVRRVAAPGDPGPGECRAAGRLTVEVTAGHDEVEATDPPGTWRTGVGD